MVWNYLGLIGDALAGLLLVAYIARHISLAAYGVLLFAMSTAGILTMFDFGFSSVLVRGYIGVKEKPEAVNRLLGTTFLLLASIGGIGVLAFLGIATLLPGPFSVPGEFLHAARIVLVLIAVSIALTMAALPLDLLLQAFHRFDRLNQLRLLLLAPHVLLSIAALRLGYGVIGLAVVAVIISLLRLLLFGASLPGCAGDARLRLLFDWGCVRDLLRQGRWALGDNLSRQLADASPSILLAAFAPIQAVALFGVAAKIPSRLSDVVWRALTAVFPAVAEHHVDEELGHVQRLYVEAWRALFTGFLPLIVLGSLCARPLLVLWAGKQFSGGAPIMCWLLVAMFSVALEAPSDMLLYAADQPKRAARVAMVESAATVLLGLLLLLRFGAVGLAAGIAIGHLLLNVLWYTPSACRVAGIPLRRLYLNALRGTQALIAVLVLLVMTVTWVSPMLSSPIVIAVAAGGGMLYMVLWLRQIIQPLRRAEVYVAV